MSSDRDLVLLAARIQDDMNRLGVARPVELDGRDGIQSDCSDPVTLFDALVTMSALREATRQLFVDGHFARAVEEAFKCVNNTVKGKAKASKPLDGQDLMLQAFSEDKPMLRINELRTDSEVNEQAGYRFIFAGVMRGIRNPRAHEHLLRDEARPALEMLVLANHLMQVVARAKRPRRQK